MPNFGGKIKFTGIRNTHDTNDVDRVASAEKLTKHNCRQVDVDDVWTELGTFGHYQLLQLILLIVFGFPQTVAVLSGVFTGKNVSPLCLVDNSTTSMDSRLMKEVNNSHSIDGEGISNITVVTTQCSIKRIFNTTDGEVVIDEKCLKYDYGEEMHSSFLSEWDLICDQEALGQLPQMLTMVGMMIGAATLPHVGDRFGRKTLALGALIAHFIVTAGLAFVNVFEMFLLLKFLTGAFNQGIMVPCYIMILELFPTEQRTLIGFIQTAVWVASVTSLVLVGYIFRNFSWRIMQLAYALYSVTILSVFFIDESLRWLVANKRVGRANSLIEKVCRINKKDFKEVMKVCFKEKLQHCPPEITSTQEGTPLDDFPYQEQAECIQTTVKKNSSFQAKPTLVDVFRSPTMRKISIIVCYSWMVNALIYYGITLLSTSLAGDPYINFFLGAVIELPSAIAMYFFLKKFGRKTVVIGFTLVAGLSLLSAVLVATLSSGGTTMGLVQTALTLFGKFCISASFNIMWIYTPELYPTNLRNVGIGISSTCARIAATASPFFSVLANKVLWAPGALFSGACFLCVFLLTFLPETGDKELPNTIADVEMWLKSGPKKDLTNGFNFPTRDDGKEGEDQQERNEIL